MDDVPAIALSDGKRLIGGGEPKLNLQDGFTLTIVLTAAMALTVGYR